MRNATVSLSGSEAQSFSAGGMDNWHFLSRLTLLERFVARAVAIRRAGDEQPDDPFRGLYVTDAHVDEILAAPGSTMIPDDAVLTRLLAECQRVDEEASANHSGPLTDIAREFALTSIDLGILVGAVAPDIDSRFEKLFGYLQDDVTRRRASIGLAIELAGHRTFDARARERVLPHAPLRRNGLLTVEETDRPFLTRPLRVPDRVAGYLLGETVLDPVVASVEDSPLTLTPELGTGLIGPLSDPRAFVYVRERAGTAARAMVESAMKSLGGGVLSLRLDWLDGSADLEDLATAAARDARLIRGALVVGPAESLESRGPAAVRLFTELACRVVLIGKGKWDPSWSSRVPLVVDAPELSRDEVVAILEPILGGRAGTGASVLDQFRLSPEQVARAAEASKRHALTRSADDDATVSDQDLIAGAREQNSAGLERLATRVAPDVSWDDLVLPPRVVVHLRELTSRARHRRVVLGEWKMRRGGGRGRGVAALFVGDSGTGKTMSAEVIAGDLGLEVYKINLATVVDKYVGETEKNLERIFDQADGVNGVLLFDEADALFGKRSEVRDAHDRYANIEVAYLLQRIEAFDGLAILSTNLRSNIDEAFTRRLDSIIDFPVPEAPERKVLWERCLGSEVPREGDLDIEFLSASFKLAGGAIRNIVTTAAYFAATRGDRMGMSDLIIATQREYRKMGRLCLESEFGPYHTLVASDPDPTGMLIIEKSAGLNSNGSGESASRNGSDGEGRNRTTGRSSRVPAPSKEAIDD